jgi:hypothetical protein
MLGHYSNLYHGLKSLFGRFLHTPLYVIFVPQGHLPSGFVTDMTVLCPFFPSYDLKIPFLPCFSLIFFIIIPLCSTTRQTVIRVDGFSYKGQEDITWRHGGQGFAYRKGNLTRFFFLASSLSVFGDGRDWLC